MAQTEWGLKRICQACGIKFYDFYKSPIICPDCSTEFDPDALLVGKRRLAAKEDDDDALVSPVIADDGVDTAADDELDIGTDDVDLGDTSDDTILEDDEDDLDTDLGVETFSDDDNEDDS